jgi:hypothetical protein
MQVHPHWMRRCCPTAHRGTTLMAGLRLGSTSYGRRVRQPCRSRIGPTLWLSLSLCTSLRAFGAERNRLNVTVFYNATAMHTQALPAAAAAIGAAWLRTVATSLLNIVRSLLAYRLRCGVFVAL